MGLPWWSRGKNPPANAGDRGWIPGGARSHMPQSNKTHVLQPLSPHTATESSFRSPQLEKACVQQGRPRAAKNK